MRFRTRLASLSAAAAVPMLAAAGLAAATILDAGSVISAGRAPTRGTVTLDADASLADPPSIPEPASPGAAPSLDEPYGNAYQLPNRGGGDEAFHATADATLAAGTYDYSTITVDAGVTLTYEGATVLRASGDVVIEGVVRTQAWGATLKILAGGDVVLRLAEGATAPAIRAEGAVSTVVVDALGDVVVDVPEGSEAHITSWLGVFVTSRGAGTSMRLAGLELGAYNHGIYLHSEGGVALDRVRLGFPITSGIYLRAFGGGGDLHACDLQSPLFHVDLGVAGPLVVDGGTVVRGNALEMRALGGALTVEGGSVVEATGVTLLAEASSDIAVRDGSSVRCLSSHSPAVVVSYEGSITVGRDGQSEPASVECPNAATLDLRAAGPVTVLPDGAVRTVEGALRIDAGRVALRGETTSRFGTVDLRGGEGISLSAPAAAWVLRGAEVRLASPSGGIDVSGVDVDARSGPFEALASGRVLIDGSVEAAGDLTVVSAEGSVDAEGATIATATAPDVSGSILVASHAGLQGTIDLRDATVLSGDAGSRSGDVTVLVHANASDDSGDGSGGTPAALALDLSRVVARHHPAMEWTMRANGGVGADLLGEGASAGVRVEVGGTGRDLVLRGRARRSGATFECDGCVLRVRRARDGASLRFVLRWKGGLGPSVNAAGDGPLQVRLGLPAGDADGEAVLERGRFVLR